MRHIPTLCIALLAAAAAMPALAGPCSDQIASISRDLGNQPDVSGSPTTGTLNGSGPDSAKSTSQAPSASRQASGTTEQNGGKLNGDSGGHEMTAVAANTATSPEDVRRQQAGLPTTADAPNVKSPDPRMAQAHQQLDRARALDAKGDPSCRDAADAASKLGKPG